MGCCPWTCAWKAARKANTIPEKELTRIFIIFRAGPASALGCCKAVDEGRGCGSLGPFLWY